MSKEWHLVCGETVLAVLRHRGINKFAEYPCLEAEAEITEAFEPLRPLFEREAALLEIDGKEENAEWLNIWEELKALGLWVQTPDGRSCLDILWIHFREGRAWWWPLYNSPQSILSEKDM